MDFSQTRIFLASNFVLDFPADCSELTKCKAAGLSPNNVIKVLTRVTHLMATESKNLSTKSLDENESFFGSNTKVSCGSFKTAYNTKSKTLLR